MRRLLIPLVGLGTVMLAGCGVWFTHGPPPGYEQMEHFSCSETNTGPILDVVFGGLNLLGSVLIAGDPEAYGYDSSNSGAVIASGVIWAGALGVSAAVGFDKVKKCRAAQQERAHRQASARAAPAAPPPPSEAPAIDSLRVDPAANTLAVGGTVQLAALAFGPSGAVVPPPAFHWSSSNDAIASVSTDGLVTAHAPGTAVIAANGAGVVGTAKVVVTSP